jgi:hypothetical protein
LSYVNPQNPPARCPVEVTARFARVGSEAS